MIHWVHSIFSAYGFWLPNDPRGSWSSFVGSYELYRFGGAATKTNEQRSLAHNLHDSTLRKDVKHVLKYPPVRFSDNQRRSIAKGFSHACAECHIPILACCIGYDHVHTVTGRHEKSATQIIALFKGRATQRMKEDGCHPMAAFRESSREFPTPWGRGSWQVFIETREQVAAAIEYVRRHPMKEGLPPQDWDFVKPL